MNRMVPVGYMAKHIAAKPDWLKTDGVNEILSVSGHVSADFADWIDFWRHNGYWLFNSPEMIVAVAEENGLKLKSTRWFYYEAYEKEYDDAEDIWRSFDPDEDLVTNITAPAACDLVGFDVVTYSCGNAAECSPLSCNHLAEHVQVNRHCLLDSFEEAMGFMNDKKNLGSEPGPLRILAVYEIPFSPTALAWKGPDYFAV